MWLNIDVSAEIKKNKNDTNKTKYKVKNAQTLMFNET